MISFIFLFLGCTNIPEKSWRNIENKRQRLVLYPGDIIIKEKQRNILGIFGHCGIMGTDDIVVDYPKYGNRIKFTKLDDWLEEGRRVIVLRYIDMDIEFQEELLKIMGSYIDKKKKYGIKLSKKQDDKFYCSQFIWYVYYKAGNKFNELVDIDSDRGIFVLPYDLIYSRKTYIVSSDMY